MQGLNIAVVASIGAFLLGSAGPLLQTDQPEPLTPAPAYAPHLFSCESSTGG